MPKTMKTTQTGFSKQTVSKTRLRDQQREDTKGTILEAAIELFSKCGFDGTTLPQIAEQSGVRVPLIVYHFKSKELLWKEAVKEIYSRVENHMASFQERIVNAKGLDFYRESSRAHISTLAKYPEYMRIFFQEGTQHSERLEWLVENHQSKMTAMIVSVIERAQNEGLISPHADKMHLKFILSGAFALPIVLAPEFTIVTNRDSLSEEFIEEHIEMCLNLILPTFFKNTKK